VNINESANAFFCCTTDRRHFCSVPVIEISETCVTVMKGSPSGDVTCVPYDYIVLCPGVKYPPMAATETTAMERISNLGNTTNLLRKAKDVLIIGGGSTAIETAAEVISVYPTKGVTLLTRSPRLLQMHSTKASDYCTRWLTKRHVRIIFEDELAKDDMGRAMEPTLQPKRTFQTAKGRTVDAV